MRTYAVPRGGRLRLISLLAVSFLLGGCLSPLKTLKVPTEDWYTGGRAPRQRQVSPPVGAAGMPDGVSDAGQSAEPGGEDISVGQKNARHTWSFHSRMSGRLSKAPQTVAAMETVTQNLPLPPPRYWHHAQTGLSFAFVPSGCFKMGSNTAATNEEPEHSVCLAPFWMGVHEITQGLWKKQMGTIPEQSKEGERLPVENVSWSDVQNFIERLNRSGSARFRLPSEAEWEFACRNAGRELYFCGSGTVDTLAWHKNNSDNHAHPVGERQANDLGLHDMSGNVWEWVADWYDADYYSVSPTRDPKGPETGTTKVFRGGAWMSDPKFLRSTLRYDLAPHRGYHLLGVRLVAMPKDVAHTSQE